MVQLYNPNVTGKQILIDTKNIDSTKLKLIENVQPLMEKIIQELNLNVVQKCEHQFEKDNEPYAANTGIRHRNFPRDPPRTFFNNFDKMKPSPHYLNCPMVPPCGCERKRTKVNTWSAKRSPGGACGFNASRRAGARAKPRFARSLFCQNLSHL